MYGQNRRSMENGKAAAGKGIVCYWLRRYNEWQRAKEECAMKRETTPIRVTDKIMELCSGIAPDVHPEYVPVAVQEWSQPMECFPNVERMVQEKGGQQINGWAIWQWANILVEAEAHSVWQSPKGELIDITPHDNEESQILFLRDDSMMYSGQKIGNVRLALTDSPLVAELIDLSQKTEAVMSDYKPGTKIPVEELQKRLAPMAERRRAIIVQMNQKAGRNDPCPCQSGLKYKKCCGRSW